MKHFAAKYHRFRHPCLLLVDGHRAWCVSGSGDGEASPLVVGLATDAPPGCLSVEGGQSPGFAVQGFTHPSSLGGGGVFLIEAAGADE